MKGYLAVFLLSPFWMLLVQAVVTRIARRAPSPPPPLPLAIFSIFAAAPGVALAAWWTLLRDLGWGAGLICALIYGSVCYACIGFSYFTLFLMSETARRIRILRELKVHGPLSPQELAAVYPPQDQVSQRLERLSGLGQIRREGGRYILSGRILWAAASVVAGWGSLIGYSWREAK